MKIFNVTRKDVLDCAEKYGVKPALDLLFIAGTDGYDGTASEYEALVEALKEGE